MLRLLTAFAAAALLAAPALAQRGLQAEYMASPSGAVTVADVMIGERLAAKADTYGARHIQQLTDTLRRDIERELAASGWLAAPGAAGSVLEVTLEDARPNRPSVAERHTQHPLDMRSLSIGGAHVSAILRAGDGRVVATYSYEWSTPDIRWSEGAGTWTDARRTFDRFATRLADSLASEGSRS